MIKSKGYHFDQYSYTNVLSLPDTQRTPQSSDVSFGPCLSWCFTQVGAAGAPKLFDLSRGLGYRIMVTANGVVQLVRCLHSLWYIRKFKNYIIGVGTSSLITLHKNEQLQIVLINPVMLVLKHVVINTSYL